MARPQIGFVVKHYPILVSEPILQLFRLFHAHGWKVHAFLEKCGRLPKLEDITTTVTVLNQLEPPRGLGFVDRVAKRLRLKSIRRLITGCASRQVARRFRSCDCLWAFDGNAFYLACSHVPPARIVYHSLELAFRDNRWNLDLPDEVFDFEIENVPKAGAVVIQGRERWDFFRKEYGLKLDENSDNLLFLPVTNEGDCVDNPARPEDIDTVLHIGGLGSHYCVPEFCDAIGDLHGWKLRLQGVNPNRPEFKPYLDAMNEGRAPHILWDGHVYDTPREAEVVCRKAHVGLAYFAGELTPNMDTAARSSGKIAMYLKYGLPFIVRDIGEFSSFLAREGCAVAISSPGEIGTALEEIRNRYREMVDACHRIYNQEYRFESYQSAVLALAENVVERSGISQPVMHAGGPVPAALKQL